MPNSTNLARIPGITNISSQLGSFNKVIFMEPWKSHTIVFTICNSSAKPKPMKNAMKRMEIGLTYEREDSLHAWLTWLADSAKTYGFTIVGMDPQSLGGGWPELTLLGDRDMLINFAQSCGYEQGQAEEFFLD